MYELIVTLDRTLTEKYRVTIEADDPEEAQDIAFDYFTEFPNGKVTPKTCLKVSDETVKIDLGPIEFVRKDETAVTNKVFSNDGDDESA